MTRLHDLAANGQSAWFDFIRRSFTRSGELQRLIDLGVRGVTSNPSIFEKAIVGSDDYDDAFLRLGPASIEAIYDDLVLGDIAEAADLFLPIYEATNGIDGYVSIEVDPMLADDTEGTIADARRLFAALGRPNIMIKVPGTPAGVPAIETLIGKGINVNVTLLFSTPQYEQIALAYIAGLETYAQTHDDLSQIASVASFFVSRMDTAVDKLLAGTERQDLAGKAAVANARVAYARFLEIFAGQRWETLAARGARVQRPLWASTGTKNPAYSDTLYVDTLIAPHTVNTLPPATLDAVLHHGATDHSLEDGIQEARELLLELRAIGIDVDEDIAHELQHDGVRLFAEAFESLMSAIGSKRDAMLAMDREGVGVLLSDQAEQDALDAALAELDEINAVSRMWAKDHTLFQPGPEEVANRLGWLRVMDEVAEAASNIDDFVEEVRQAGYTHAVLLGMGGSSLAPELFAKTFGVAEGFLHLEVLDSTAPEAVHALGERISPATTLFVVATKSGGTVETFSFMKHFYTLVSKALPRERAGDHFVAITDAGSGLADVATRLRFRKTFFANPEIGGRYSALSHFGMVPAALVGVDIRRLLANASEAAKASAGAQSSSDAPGILLGAAIGELAKLGRDKLTFLLPHELASFGDWVEQLIAESTGKHGKGILPVIGESAVFDAGDRVYVRIALPGSHVATPPEGHPCIDIERADLYDLGAQFFEWEFATAIACQRLGINPFDQPNVESAKAVAREMVAAYQRDGSLPVLEPAFTDQGIAVFGETNTTNLREAILDFLGHAREAVSPKPYVAIHAYLAPNAAMSAALAKFRLGVESATGHAVTVGYGPRFLHSTGQLHKGDAGHGLFIQLVSQPMVDVPIPDEAPDETSSIGFAALIGAQSLGDRQALIDAGRRVLRLDLGTDVAHGLATVTAAID